MQHARKIYLTSPFMACYTAVLSLSFLMTLAFAMLMNGGNELMRSAHQATAIVFTALVAVYALVSGRSIVQLFDHRKVLVLVLVCLCAVVSGFMSLFGISAATGFHTAAGLLLGVCGVFFIINYFGSK